MMQTKEDHIARLEAETAAVPRRTSLEASAVDSSGPEARSEAATTSDPELQDALHTFLTKLRKGTGLDPGRHPRDSGIAISYKDIREKHKVWPQPIIALTRRSCIYAVALPD